MLQPITIQTYNSTVVSRKRAHVRCTLHQAQTGRYQYPTVILSAQSGADIVGQVSCSLVPRPYPSFFNARARKKYFPFFLACVEKAGIRPGYEAAKYLVLE